MKPTGAVVSQAASGLLAVLVFTVLAFNIGAGSALVAVDIEVANALRARATPALTGFMMLVTTLNSTLMVALYAAVIAGREAWLKRWNRAASMIACVGGGLLLNDLVKLAFHRARPLLEHPLLTLPTYSFPSGHVAGSTLFYGLLVVWAFDATPRWRWRIAAIAAAATLVALVAMSRLYLGVHFLSDVVAAMAEALGWIALCLWAQGVF